MSQQNSAAYGRRQIVRMQLRRILFDGLRLWQKFLGRPRGDYLLLRGRVRDTEARLNWYLPTSIVPVCSEPSSTAGQFGPAKGIDPALLGPHVALVSERPSGRAHVVYSGGVVSSALQVLRRPSGVTLVSPSLYASADNAGYLRLRRSFAPKKHEEGAWPLEELFREPVSWAVLAATGPSADGFGYEACASAEVRVICNSAVRNVELLKAFKPNIMCFGDPVFHMGPTEYASAFRADLRHAASLLDPLVIVVPEHYRDLLSAQMPELAGRVVGLKLAKVARRVPAPEQGAACRRTGNVLTQQMLPMALQLRPQRLSLIGCDGRRKGERYFWSHGKGVQYSDELMNGVFESHPAFFRDVSYSDYYERHCDEVAGWVGLAESAGAIVDTLTPSFVPVLAQRLAAP